MELPDDLLTSPRGWVVSWTLIHVTAAAAMIAFGESVLPVSWPVYAAGVGGSAVLWWFFGQLAKLVTTAWVRVVYAGAMGLLTAIFVIVGAGVYWRFGCFGLPSLVLRVSAPTVVWYILNYLVGALGLLFVAVWVGTGIFWFLSPDASEQRAVSWPQVTFAAALIVIGSAFVIPRAETTLFPPDVTAVAVIGSSSMYKPSALSEPNRTEPELPDSSTESGGLDWNVVVICQESWTRHYLNAYNDGRESLFPRIEEWAQTQGDRAVWFDHHLTTSAWTELVMPSLLTGTGLEEGLEPLHRRPLMWSWFSEAGATTGFFSSQYYHIGRLHSVLFEQHDLDRKATASTMDDGMWFGFGRPPSIDDLRTAKQTAEFIRQAPEDKPLFAFAMSNSLHFPKQTASEHIDPAPDEMSTHARAARIADSFAMRIIDALRETGRLERTFVVVFGDHGMPRNDLGHEARMISFFEPVFRVPMLLRVPDAWAKRHTRGLQTLHDNRDRPTSHIDLLPTLLSMARLLPGDDKTRGQLVGRGADLTDRKLSTRNLFMVVRSGSNLGASFFVMGREHWRFAISQFDGAFAFDLQSDPTQQHNLWPDIPTQLRDAVDESFERFPGIRAIYDGCQRMDCAPRLDQVFRHSKN